MTRAAARVGRQEEFGDHPAKQLRVVCPHGPRSFCIEPFDQMPVQLDVTGLIFQVLTIDEAVARFDFVVSLQRANRNIE